MTEKMTFRVDQRSLGRDYNDYGWIVSGIETVVAEGVNHFDDDKWDMEVTFTEKVKPVQVDSVVRRRNWPTWLDSGEPIYFVVKAIVADKAWIAYKDQKREDMLTSLDRLYFDE